MICRKCGRFMVLASKNPETYICRKCGGMVCENCGTVMTPLFNGDFPTIWKCPNCGHLEVEEEGDVQETEA
jgi:DNA-directed RNA polymerase subunit M/transcription elongation factor TFIIS